MSQSRICSQSTNNFSQLRKKKMPYSQSTTELVKSQKNIRFEGEEQSRIKSPNSRYKFIPSMDL